MGFLDNYSSQIKGIMRIVFGLLFLEHGLNKMIGFPMAAGATHHAFNLMAFPVGPAGVIEVVGGILILLGLFSRYAAFIASGEMAFAYFLAHFPRSPFPLINGGGEAICFCFVFLFLAAAGPGSFAINQK
ncbi:MAG TPA: DoxX family protein [Rhizomicrobium sp.]|nr:DoxX family protein [Rhizomicrobium sp.]